MAITSSPGGTTQDSRGALEQNEGSQSDPASVTYETHKKLLSEKKKRDEENVLLKTQLEEFQMKERSREEDELKKQKNFEQLLKLREEELHKERNEKNSLRAMAEKGLKRRAFLDSVNGAIDEQYWGLINLEEIAVDPATGMPDEASVHKAARDFEVRYPLVLQGRAGGPKLPADAARGGGTKLTYEQWVRLPLKEQKARIKEVMSG